MDEFKVKKGKKIFCGPRWKFLGLNKEEFNIKAFFWSNCEYSLGSNIGQINKLAGQSFRILPFYDRITGKIRPGHHKDSARVGWRFVDGEIELLAYVYIDGCRDYKTIMKIKTESWVHINFKVDKYKYVFKAIDEEGNSSIVEFNSENSKKGFIRLFIYKLYPYFGGIQPAPHDMRITLKYLKKFL